MPFPFYWIGAFVAGLLLAGVLAIFGLALDVLTRATTEVRGTVLPGLVAGFREWTTDRGGPARRPASPQGTDPTSSIEDTVLRDGPPLERVHAHVL
jgi:hypothetical protein